MILLRQPPFPLSLQYSGLDPETEYILEIYTNKSVLLYSFRIESNEDGEIYKEIPKYFEKFDADYSLYVYSVDSGGNAEDTKVIDTLTIKRPYINPMVSNPFDSELEYQERVARMVIDHATGGFYYKDDTVESFGLGGDFLSMPNRINKINQVYKNNVKVYDRFAEEDVFQEVYVISPDHSAITIFKEGVYNRTQNYPQSLPLAASDSFNLYSDSSDPIAALTKIKEFDLFPKDYDYVITGEFGWPVVPQDIQDATRMLIDDISCGKLQYVSQYIKEYKTDQFTIKYDDLSVKGTGNLIVDQILSKYQNNFYRMGVL
jgi:hypothetical protein